MNLKKQFCFLLCLEKQNSNELPCCTGTWTVSFQIHFHKGRSYSDLSWFCQGTVPMLSTLNVHLGSWQRSQKLYFDYDLNFYTILRVTPAFTGAFRFLPLSKFWIFVLLLKVMASGPITSRQIDGETMARVTDFIVLSSKITGDGDCSPEIKGRLLLGRKAMTNLDSILKSRDISADKAV